VSNKKIPVLVNRAGGAAAAAGESLAESLTAAFAAAGAEANVQFLEGGEMREAIRRAADTGRVVVAGGDGTAASAAGTLAGSDSELALLPLGTLNHLARDLSIPPALEDAAKIAVEGTATPIDLGRVNDHIFVNNASIGLYPFMVRHREGYRARRGWPKWLASIPAAWDALSRLPHHRLRIDMGNGQEPLITPLLFVGNNVYSLESGTVGSRASLRDGTLSVYAVARRSRLALLWFGVRAILGRVDRATDFVALGECTSVKVHSHSRSGMVDVGLDGEIRRLSFPLRFEIMPGALHIVSPPEEASEA
jgi:diacylglycerol kinase family enzyme